MRISIEQLKRYTLKRFELREFRANQEALLTDIFLNKNIIATQPTGFGKSLCYQSLAAISRKLIVVIQPYIALIHDQLLECKKYELAAGALHSELSILDRQELAQQFKDNSLRILFVTPERLECPDFIALITTANVSRVVVDEAHCITSMGDGFRSAYSALLDRLHCVNSARSKMFSLLFLSATLTSDNIEIIRNSFPNYDFTNHIDRASRSNLKIEIRELPEMQKISAAIDLVRRTSGYGCTIIYVSSKHMAETLSTLLARKNLAARGFHAGLADCIKVETLDWFKKSSNGVLVTTSALSAGFNKPNVRTVIHYHPARTVEDYAQEIGRAGRDGNHADAITFYDRVNDTKLNESLLQGSAPGLELVAGFGMFLSEMLTTGVVAFDLTVDELKRFKGCHQVTQSALRTLLSRGKSAGVLEFFESGYGFYVIVYSQLGNGLLADLISSHYRIKERYRRMTLILDSTNCKHREIKEYFTGEKCVDLAAQCGCCFGRKVPVAVLPVSTLRSRLMQLRSKFSKSSGLPAQTLLPANTVERILQAMPGKKNDLSGILNASQCLLMGDSIISALR